MAREAAMVYAFGLFVKKRARGSPQEGALPVKSSAGSKIAGCHPDHMDEYRERVMDCDVNVSFLTAWIQCQYLEFLASVLFAGRSCGW